MGTTKDNEMFTDITTKRCFYCGAGFHNEANYVYWLGGEVIVMHPTCALTLAKHLVKDAMLTWKAAGQMSDENLAIGVLQIVETIDRIMYWAMK